MNNKQKHEKMIAHAANCRSCERWLAHSMKALDYHLETCPRCESWFKHAERTKLGIANDTE